MQCRSHLEVKLIYKLRLLLLFFCRFAPIFWWTIKKAQRCMGNGPLILCHYSIRLALRWLRYSPQESIRIGILFEENFDFLRNPTKESLSRTRWRPLAGTFSLSWSFPATSREPPSRAASPPRPPARAGRGRGRRCSQQSPPGRSSRRPSQSTGSRWLAAGTPAHSITLLYSRFLFWVHGFEVIKVLWALRKYLSCLLNFTNLMVLVFNELDLN